MMYVWDIDSARTTSIASDLSPKTVDRVLVYYEGPRWLILSEGDRRFVAYAADEDDDGRKIRWLEIDISSVELRALCTGKMPLRDCLIKDDVCVVDRTPDRDPIAAWRMSPSDIPTDCLPDHNALLPTFARYMSTDDAPAVGDMSFACDGPPVRGHTMSFAAVGALTSAIQRLWSALAQSLKVSDTVHGEWDIDTLAFAGSRRGSFAIDVKADPQGIAKIATKYREVARNVYASEDDFESIVSAYDDHLRLAYENYLQIIQLYRLDVFADWHEDGAFVSYRRSKRVFVGRQPAAIESRRTTVDIRAVGFFTGWMTEKKKFEFYDTKTGEQYIGKISKKEPSLKAKRLPALGTTDAIYEAAVRVRTDADGKTSYTLLRFTTLR